MPKAYIIARRAISYRRYITRPGRNGYHCKKPLLSGRQKRFLHGTPDWISPKGDKLTSGLQGFARCKPCLILICRPLGSNLDTNTLRTTPHPKGEALFLVRPTGFEPAAYRVGVCHSIQLSYGRVFSYYQKCRYPLPFLQPLARGLLYQLSASK